MTDAEWSTLALAALSSEWIEAARRFNYSEAAFRDHLCDALAPAARNDRDVQREVSADLVDWPDVGRFDVAIAVPAGGPLACVFETKWAKRGANINEALWDAAKLALAVAVARTVEAYLLYAGTARAFEREGVGRELFAGAAFDLGELIHRYPSWWDWPVKTRPTRLPARLTTDPAGALEWRSSAGERWQVRCLRVRGESASWIEVSDGWPERRTSTQVD